MYPNRTIRWLLIAILPLLLSVAASAQALISMNFGPPALPVYYQPPCPAQGYFWVPGYWASSPYGYYWVPGTWVLAPQPGLLWTPGYWAYDGGGLYYWHPGYWAPVVGYYGGINYGYGYPGAGYYGGYWRRRAFYYNQTVNNVNITNVQNVYNQRVIIHNTTVTHVSYNGGPGGTTARPTPEQEAAARQQHVAPTAAQTQHEHAASTNRDLLASVNQGRPPIAATPKPAEFSGRGVVAADRAGAPYKAPSNAPENRAVTAREVPRPPTSEVPAASNSEQARENSVPRPPNSVPRPETEPRRGSAPPPRAPRPEHEAIRQSPPRPEGIPRPQNAPRPEAAPHPQSPPRSQNEPPRARVPQPQNNPHKETRTQPENPSPNPENRPQ